MFDYLKKIIEQVSRIDESIDDYKKLSPSGAMPAIAQVNKAIKLIKNKKFQEAETILLEADELYPSNEYILKTLGYLYEVQKNFKQAVIFLEKALYLNPIKKDLFLRLGYAQLSAHDNEGALKTFKNGKKVFVADSEIITGYGMALYRLERYSVARVEFIKAFSIDSHNLNALFLCATIDTMLGDYERAEKRLDLLVKIAPNPVHYYEYAKLKQLKKQYDLSIDFAQKAIKKNKTFLPAYLLLADVYNQKNDNDTALEYLKKAEELGLGNSALYISKANIYMYKEDFSSAVQAYRTANDYGPQKSIDIQVLICELMLDNIENKDTIVNIMTLGVAEEENKELQTLEYMLLGIWHYKKSEFLQAEEMLSKALEITLKLPIVYYIMAKCYCELKDTYKAEKYFKLVLEKNPTHYLANKDYIEFLMNNQNYEQAKYKIKNALKYFPDDENFENSLFLANYKLLVEPFDSYNVKELLKLAEKLEKNSVFLYANERNELLTHKKKGLN